MTGNLGPIIARGRTAEIFRWQDNQVIKLFLERYPASDAEREARSTQAAFEAGLSAPEVEGTVEVKGRTGIIFERVEGPSMLADITLKPWEFHRSARLLAELHATIHSYTIPELRSQREKLQRDIQHADLLPVKTKETILNILEDLSDGNAVCHGDFHPDNIIMSSRGPIVIDWLDASRGNPLADVARTSLLLRHSEPQAGAPLRWIMKSFRTLFHSAYLKSYLRLRPTSRQEISAWQLPVAAARLHENLPEEEKKRLMAIIEKKLAELD